MPKDEALQAALDLIGDIPHRIEKTRDNHTKLLIAGAKKIVYISPPAKGRDLNLVKNVKQDVRHALRSIEV